MPDVLTPHINDYPNKDAYKVCLGCPFDLPPNHLIADHPRFEMPSKDAEHAQLERAVIEAAKAFEYCCSTSDNQWDKGVAMVKLSKATQALLEFEAKTK